MFSFNRRSKERTSFFRVRLSTASIVGWDFSMASRRERSMSLVEDETVSLNLRLDEWLRVVVDASIVVEDLKPY